MNAILRTTRVVQKSASDGESICGVLDGRQLLLAIAGTLRDGSPLIGWARELADLHATLITASLSATRRPADFDAAATRERLTTLTALIDDWSVRHLPRPQGTRRHTHSLGEVISHIADAYAQLQWTLRHSANTIHHHGAALRFAQIQEGYADLVDDIRGLRVTLPLGSSGIIRLSPTTPHTP